MYKDIGGRISDGFKTYLDEDAIKNSIRNIIMTKKGTVPGKPYFGSNIYNVIFELVTPLTLLVAKNYVTEALSEFENRIDLTSVDVNYIEEYNKMTIDVLYRYVLSSGIIQNAKTSIAINV